MMMLTTGKAVSRKMMRVQRCRVISDSIFESEFNITFQVEVEVLLANTLTRYSLMHICLTCPDKPAIRRQIWQLKPLRVDSKNSQAMILGVTLRIP